MPRLLTQSELRAASKLPFCYLCGQKFDDESITDRDHVPPKAVFAVADRQPLILRSHRHCNHSRHLADEKIGQLISLVRRVAPRTDVQRLRVRWTRIGPALVNLDIEAEVWRWIAAFHAALYHEHLCFSKTDDAEKPFMRTITLPFPKARTDKVILEPVLPQHLRIVETIKSNRMFRNLDQLVGNKGKLVYECIWDRSSNSELWYCAFALNVYDWKQLGLLRNGRACGCAGIYVTGSKSKPPSASVSRRSTIILPNYDVLDPFAA